MQDDPAFKKAMGDKVPEMDKLLVDAPPRNKRRMGTDRQPVPENIPVDMPQGNQEKEKDELDTESVCSIASSEAGYKRTWIPGKKKKAGEATATSTTGTLPTGTDPKAQGEPTRAERIQKEYERRLKKRKTALLRTGQQVDGAVVKLLLQPVAGSKTK